MQVIRHRCEAQCQRREVLPASPRAKALKYALARQASLQVFLSGSDLAIDTSHLERGLRVIPTGKRNWSFCWTGIGAARAGVIQSLLASYKLRGGAIPTPI